MFLGHASAVESGWNYDKNGADWSKLNIVDTGGGPRIGYGDGHIR
jgi:hypothetical protein